MSDPATGAARFGWTSLALFAALGAVLEAAHGFKLAAYLDDELTRLLLRLAHAHGVGLALVVLVFGVSAAPRLPQDSSSTPPARAGGRSRDHPARLRARRRRASGG